MESSISVTQRININQIVKEYGVKLKGFIRKRVNSVEDSEDILQEVFYQLTESERLMKPIDHVSGWLYTVARNKIKDLYRKKKNTSFSDLAFEQDEDTGLEELGQLILDLGDDPEDQYLQTLIQQEIESALNELPAEQRMVFELNELMGVSFKEISKQTGEQVNTLISRKHYAVIHLRKRLEYLYNELINE